MHVRFAPEADKITDVWLGVPAKTGLMDCS